MFSTRTLLKALPRYRRAFSVSCVANGTNRAVVYTSTGDPKTVLSVRTFNEPAPVDGTLTVKIVLAPINPADINVIEGAYPERPTLGSQLGAPDKHFIGGNECLAEVLETSPQSELKVGDWVVMSAPQVGTWAARRTVKFSDVIKVARRLGEEIDFATLSINPATAFRMLEDFITLKEGDYIFQNGANSAVGQAVIQIAARRGIKTINFIRTRPDIESLIKHLTTLGATHVLTYDDLENRALMKSKMEEWTGKNKPRLFLNCVSGPTTSAIAHHLGHNAHIVSYGAMSKQPLSLPTSHFIFKDLSTHGFWMTRWYKANAKNTTERESMMNQLIEYKLEAPRHGVLVIPRDQSDEEATNSIRETFQKLAKGQYGKKVLLQIDSPE